MSDEHRRGVATALLLEPTTALENNEKSLLLALFIIQFALGSQGATVRKEVSSNVAVRKLSGMFSSGGEVLIKLGIRIDSTRTSEGVARCVGALSLFDPCI